MPSARHGSKVKRHARHENMLRISVQVHGRRTPGVHTRETGEKRMTRKTNTTTLFRTRNNCFLCDGTLKKNDGETKRCYTFKCAFQARQHVEGHCNRVATGMIRNQCPKCTLPLQTVPRQIGKASEVVVSPNPSPPLPEQKSPSEQKTVSHLSPSQPKTGKDVKRKQLDSVALPNLELERKKRMAENEAKMVELGLSTLVAECKKPKKSKKPRLQNLPRSRAFLPRQSKAVIGSLEERAETDYERSESDYQDLEENGDEETQENVTYVASDTTSVSVGDSVWVVDRGEGRRTATLKVWEASVACEKGIRDGRDCRRGSVGSVADPSVYRFVGVGRRAWRAAGRAEVVR